MQIMLVANNGSRVQQAARSLRERVAYGLRALANRVDGHDSVTISLTTRPAMSPQAKAECFRHGVKAIERAAAQVMRDERAESILRQFIPQLFNVAHDPSPTRATRATGAKSRE